MARARHDAILDHDMIVDLEQRIYIVFGSVHPPGRIYAYLKYIPQEYLEAGGKSIWIYRNIPLKRVVERYSINHVRRVFERYQEKAYEITYGAEIPYVSRDRVYKILNPEERAYEIYLRPRDSLEFKVAEFIDLIKSYVGVPLDSIGVGGSILGGFHNTAYSDIDLLIYGCDNIRGILENIESILKPLENEDLLNWISNQTTLHGIDLDLAKMMYRIYRRGVYKDKYVSIVFPQDYCAYPCRYTSKTIKCVEVEGFVEPEQCGAIQYPGEALIKLRGSYRSDIEDEDGEVKIMIYEGSFSPILYEGGFVKVRGSLQKVYDFRTGEEYYTISLGTRECRSLVAPLDR
ncbi:MAG: hypothetical protein QXJ51_01345 [Sulfolobales archaeon]